MHRCRLAGFQAKLCLISLLLLTANSANAKTIPVSAQNFEESLNRAIDSAQSGDVVQMPRGRFYLKSEILVDKAGLTRRGAKDKLIFEHFAVEDTAGI